MSRKVNNFCLIPSRFLGELALSNTCSKKLRDQANLSHVPFSGLALITGEQSLNQLRIILFNSIDKPIILCYSLEQSFVPFVS